MSSLRVFHGSSKTRSSQVRIHPCSGRLRAGALEPVDLLGDRVVCRLRRLQLGQLRAELGDDVAVALAELLANRLQLLAQEVLALLLVDALGDVVADRLGDLQLGDVVARPVEDQLDPLADVDRGEHCGTALVVELGPRGDTVGEGARMARDPQQLGEPPGPAQLGDDPEHAAQLAGERLDARGRPRVGDRLGVGVGRPRSDWCRAPMRARPSMRTTAAGSPDGSEPTSGTWATTAISPLPVCSRTRARRWCGEPP